MNEKIKLLDSLLDKIRVSGDDVILMYNARRTLQEINAELNEKTETKS